MAQTTGIEWTDATLNVSWGCTKKSPECGECYIPNTPPFRKAGLAWERGNIPLQHFPERLSWPVRWRKPKRIFVNSLSDTFHEDMPVELIDGIFGVAAACAQLDRGHVFQILTKRPERAYAYLYEPGVRERIATRANEWAPFEFGPWPLPNVWLGTTIGIRSSIHRAHTLAATPAAVRFVSAEPLLGPLVCPACKGNGSVAPWGGLPGGAPCPEGCGNDGKFEDPREWLRDIDWLICGGESGNHLTRKPYRFLVDVKGEPRADRLHWVRDLREACIANDVAFFFKQFGGRTPKSGGRELDGRTWDEFPQVQESAGSVAA